ncbi:MAG: putative toxin-antitoxin system toxin component, PIN family [bacterium]
MRIFFDTNVIISAIVTMGGSFGVIKDSVYKHEIFYTDYLLKETRKILTSKFPLPDKIINGAVSLIRRYFIKGKTAEKAAEVCRDPDDNQLLADAVVNKIEIFVTGDKDLLVLKEYQGVRIIPPKDYWTLPALPRGKKGLT